MFNSDVYLGLVPPTLEDFNRFLTNVSQERGPNSPLLTDHVKKIGEYLDVDNYIWLGPHKNSAIDRMKRELFPEKNIIYDQLIPTRDTNKMADFHFNGKIVFPENLEDLILKVNQGSFLVKIDAGQEDPLSGEIWVQKSPLGRKKYSISGIKRNYTSHSDRIRCILSQEENHYPQQYLKIS